MDAIKDYIDAGMTEATYTPMSDGDWVGRIPGCIGVVVFSPTRKAAESELRSTFDEWIQYRLRNGRVLPPL